MADLIFNEWIKYETADKYYYKPLQYPGLMIYLERDGCTKYGKSLYTVLIKRELPDGPMAVYLTRVNKDYRGMWTLQAAKRHAHRCLSGTFLVNNLFYTKNEIELFDAIYERAWSAGFDAGKE